jgi:hypothetical protein
MRSDSTPLIQDAEIPLSAAELEVILSHLLTARIQRKKRIDNTTLVCFI